MSILKYYITIIFFFVNCVFLVGQNLSFEEYTDKDGLPSMKTYNIVQDHTGILWIGTENGLVSFDGEEFVRFSHPDLIDNDIIQVTLNRNGRIYFLNISEQLGYVEKNEVRIINTSEVSLNIKNIISKKEKDYLVTLKSGNRIIFEIAEKSPQKFFFIRTDIYFFDAENQNVYHQISKDEFLSVSDSIILKKRKNSIGYNSDNGIYIIKGPNKYLDLYKVDEYLYHALEEMQFLSIIIHEEGFFIIKGNGVTYYNPKTKTFLPIFEGIKVNTIFFDLENNTWVSTSNNGLLKISNLFTKLNQEQLNFSLSNGINDIFQDKNGNIYLGTISSEVIINPFKQKKKIKLSDYKRPVQITTQKNNIVAYDNKAIALIDGESQNHELFSNYFFNHKSILARDSQVYIGTPDGILNLGFDHYIDPNFKSIYPFNIESRVSSLYHQLNSDTIFVGTTKGLFYYMNNVWGEISVRDFKSLNISCIIEGEQNSIWVGTRSNGIFNIKNNEILTHYNKKNGLLTNNITNLEINGTELLLSTKTGLIIIDLLTDDIKIVNEYNFLPTNEVLVCKVINGKYWIGTIEGLTILSKEMIKESKTKLPLLTLKEMYVNGINRDYSTDMELNHTQNNIQLNLQNISFKSGKDKYVKYRIPFIDTTWITTLDQTLRLPSLNPGKYHIEAVGLNSIGVESKPLNIFFKINSPWWTNWWARIIAFLILVGVVNLLLLLRSKRIRKEETVKHNYLKQINKIKDQALQLQMNPHFIFNSLNAIQGFIGTDEEEMAMNYLARFARLIRLIFEHSKGNTITLEEELEFINLYLDLEKLRFKEKVNVQMTIDPELDSIKDVLKVPPLLIQPIIENSFKHGLFHKKGKGHLIIDYRMQNEVLQVIIQDDGIGRVESNKITQRNNEKQTSSGIKTTIERIDLLNFGKDKKLNSAEIIDLYDDAGNAMGTKTIMKLNFISKKLNEIL